MKNAVRFVVVCAERTGSNLLIGMLDSHPDCLAAGELFNPRLIEKDAVPGLPAADRQGLVDLRRADPAAFVDHVFNSGENRGYQATGFKFMYSHEKSSALALDRLSSDTGIHVLHLKRKNLLRRFVSHRQAKLSGVWGQGTGAAKLDNPAVGLEFHEVMADLIKTEKCQADFAARFRDHRVLEIFYEDLAAAPHEVAARAASFLGLRADLPLQVKLQKTGSDSLRDAVVNYEELKADMLRWVSFFED